MPPDKRADAAFLRKPFTSMEFLTKVRQVIMSNLAVDE
jgi:hypothetical protein